MKKGERIVIVLVSPYGFSGLCRRVRLRAPVRRSINDRGPNFAKASLGKLSSGTIMMGES